MSKNIDLQFRPKSYFRPEKLEKYLLSKVKGAVLRRRLKTLFEEGRHDEVRNLVGDAAFSAADRKVLESVHPMFMGGNYLPDTEEGEVEIARISIRSTTYDVTSVYARPVDGAIHYRVVDEYGGETLQRPSEATSTTPMTLGEFADFFLTAWPLIDVLESNYEDDVDGALGFFSADSDFYPDLDLLCRQRVREHFPEPDAGDECPFCGHFNSPGSEDLCKHAAAWVQDGEVKALGGGREFAAVQSDLQQFVESAGEGSAIQAMLEAQAHRSPARKGLIDTASFVLDDVLETLVDAQEGSGWSMMSVPGGFGHTLCVRDSSRLEHLIQECRAILRACSFRIQTEDEAGADLEGHRPAGKVAWLLVASGCWSEDSYHSGHIAYYIANPNPGCWVMDALERNEILDDVTQEDVEEGRLNDDQIQAMWGQTLEEAQNEEYRHIVAWAEGVDPDWTAEEMAAVLYRAVCESGGNEISEPDDCDSLLDV